MPYTVEPCYNAVVGIHGGGFVIDEAPYSKVLPEPYFILGPDNANHVCNKINMCFLIIRTESLGDTTDYMF